MLAAVSPRLAARVFLDRFASPGRRRLDAIDRTLLVQARLSRLPVPGGFVQLYEWGPVSGDVPTVIIVHGWGSHAPRFSAFVEAILARGWRALAFDAPGHGRSSGRRSSLMQFRATLDAVVAARGPVQGFIAHSLGALALVMRLADPDATPARAAVLISMPRDAAYLLDLYLDAIHAAAPVRERVRAGFIARYGLPIESLGRLADAARIRCPVLVVHDTGDESVPVEHAHALHALLPDGELHLTRGLGHNRLLRDAHTVDKAMAFLAARLAV